MAWDEVQGMGSTIWFYLVIEKEKAASLFCLVKSEPLGTCKMLPTNPWVIHPSSHLQWLNKKQVLTVNCSTIPELTFVVSQSLILSLFPSHTHTLKNLLSKSKCIPPTHLRIWILWYKILNVQFKIPPCSQVTMLGGCHTSSQFDLLMFLSSVDGRVRRYDLRAGELYSDYIGSECCQPVWNQWKPQFYGRWFLCVINFLAIEDRVFFQVQIKGLIPQLASSVIPISGSGGMQLTWCTQASLPWFLSCLKVLLLQSLLNFEEIVSTVQGIDCQASVLSYIYGLLDAKVPSTATLSFLGPITCVCFSKDGQCTLAASLDSTLRLLDKDTGELLGE